MNPESLLVSHLPQVRLVAEAIHERLRFRTELDDLIGFGVLGLLQAIERFDSSRGVLLKTYAEHRIRGAILDGLRNLDWLPRHARQQQRRDQEARYQTEDSQTASLPAVAPSSRKPGNPGAASPRPLMEILYAGANLEALEKVSQKAGLRNLLGATQEDPETLYQRKEMREKMVRAIVHLPRRHREIIHLYYHQELSMKQIAERLRVHESRVSQLHAWALERLRRSLAGALVRKAAVPPLRKNGRAHRPAGPSSKYFLTASQSSSVSTPMVSSAVSAT